jgi:hypothetical protein
MPGPQPGLQTEFCARNLLAVEEITTGGCGFGVGFAGTRTNGRLSGAGAAVLDYLLIRRG